MRQVNTIISSFENQKYWVSFLWKWCIPLVVLGVVGFKVFDQSLMNNFGNVRFFDNIAWLLFSLSLLPLNILIEAKKWHLLVNQFQKVSLFQSLKIVLSGRSLNAFVPLAIGDLYIRIAQIASPNRKRAVGALALARGAQMLPTLVFGGMSIFFLIKYGITSYENLVFYVIGLLAVLLFSFFVLKNWIVKNSNFSSYLIAFQEFTLRLSLSVVLLSFLRYLVFSLQFFAAFYWLGWTHDFQILLFGIAWIFLIKSIIPDISVIGDLAKREISAVAFFSLFSIDLDIVVVASFMVWIINIVIPSIVGLLFLPQVKNQWT